MVVDPTEKMAAHLLLRFLLGGAIVSVFAAIAEMFEPKTFAGIFGAAPSVALATLALAFGQHGSEYVAIEGRSTIVGALGLLAYSAACVGTAKERRLPVWLGAAAAWCVWLAVVFLIWRLGVANGVFA